ncbi:hypothetical protein [Guptibacillus spartinae]|uniref:hypothetical protein n=1 Tax=Guptibacillus spartinae TaxID=3025679 RepID=UPI00235F0208|nr:hypothetical protein [Pseudalkalibacillus spartinae]
MRNIRRLSEEEVQALSMEMKVCYMLQAWNNVADPQTPEEWAKEVGFFNYKKIGVSNNDPVAIKKALEDAEYHIQYINTFII